MCIHNCANTYKNVNSFLKGLSFKLWHRHFRRIQPFNPVQLFINCLEELADGRFPWISLTEFKQRGSRKDWRRQKTRQCDYGEKGCCATSQVGRCQMLKSGAWVTPKCPGPACPVDRHCPGERSLNFLLLGLLEKTVCKAAQETPTSTCQPVSKSHGSVRQQPRTCAVATAPLLCCSLSPSCLLCHILSMTGRRSAYNICWRPCSAGFA